MLTTKYKRYIAHVFVLLALVGAGYSTASAKDREFDAIANHLKSRYRAKRKGIPFMGLARFAVKIVRPAGVKSINVTIFEELQHPGSASQNELQQVMRNALSPEWQPLVRVRARNGEQTCVYATQAGKDIKLMVVVIDRTEAVIVRVKLSPTSLAKWMENPKILGISLKS
jgi:hypothetical protein